MKQLFVVCCLFFLVDSFGQFCWEAQTSSISNGIRAIHFAPGVNTTGIYVTNSGEIGRTDDGGDNWTVTTSLPVLYGDFATVLMTTAHMVDEQTCFASSFAGQLYKSTDSGDNWTLNYETDQTNSYTYRIRESNGRLFLAAFKKLFYSDDYGDSWDSLTVFDGSITGLSMKGDNGVLIDYPNKLYVTSNLGNNWTQLTGLPQTENMTSVHMVDSETFITVAEGGEVYGTDNGGSSWVSINTGTTEVLENVEFGDDNIGLISGLNGTLLSTSTGIFGPWTNSTNGSNNTSPIYALHAHTGTYAWFANDNAEIFKAPCLPETIDILEFIRPDTVCLSETFDYTIQYEVVQGVAENPAFEVLIDGEGISGGFIEHTGVFNPGLHTLNLNGNLISGSEGAQSYTVTVVPNLASTATILDVFEPVDELIVSDCSSNSDSLNSNLTSFAFSPNNDASNDLLILDFLEGTNNTLNIYNRWGDLLVKFIDYDNSSTVWNGSYNGRTVDAGTYFFVSEYDQGTQQSGWIQVVK
ncbi:MAG: gliding motility-associated-like protein [Arenicella sp.]|jgi:gliding motility-associated-like protein